MDAIRDGSDVTLPAEVIFTILEAVAVASYPHTASRLLLISRAACQWLEPVVYHTIVLQSPAQSDRFKTTVRQRRLRDPEFFHRNVRVIVCQLPSGGVHDSTLKYLLMACNHVDHVSCASESIAQALPAGALRSLRYLNVQGSYIPSLPTVTHLVFRNYWEDPIHTRSTMNHLKLCLPNLTHLCLDVKIWYTYRDAAADVLSVILSNRPPSIEHLVIVLQFAFSWSLHDVLAQREYLDAPIRSAVGAGEGRTMPICFSVLPPSVDEEMSSLQDIPGRDVAAVLGWDASFAGNIWERAEEVLSSRTE